jgi:OOP family OmpA-OmpF porin
MIKKIIGVAVCFTAIITQAGAQGLEIELNGGLQGTQYPLQYGQNHKMPGGSLGLNYTFRLSSRWGLLTGISVGLYRTQASLQDSIVFTSYQVDDAGSAFQYSIKTEGYKETQQFFAASIPLMLQYHTPGAGTRWYFDCGGKIFIPFNTSIQVSAERLSLSGYYPDFNVEVSNLPQHGFGTITGWKASSNAKLKSAAALSAASGISFSLSPGTRLYTGLYIDYGLTGLKEKNDSMLLVTYSSKGITGVRAGSVLNMPNTGQVTLLSFGLQLKLSFGSAKPKHADRAVTKEEKQQPANDTIRDDQYWMIERPVVFGILGETSVPEIEKPHLTEVAKIMKQYPGIRVSIVGHICDDEMETENRKVGAARAKAVARYLQGKGIDRGRMDISSVSKSDPVMNYSANYRNRRVDITVE